MPTALWRKSCICEDGGLEGVEMMVSFQDRPEVVSWCRVDFGAMVRGVIF